MITVRMKDLAAFLPRLLTLLFVVFLPVWVVLVWGLSVDSPYEGFVIFTTIPAMYAWIGLLLAITAGFKHT